MPLKKSLMDVCLPAFSEFDVIFVAALGPHSTDRIAG